MDANDVPVRHEGGQRAERDAVVRIVECRDEHDAVGDVEIRVARRQALAAHHHGAREGEFNELKCPIVRPGELEPFHVVYRTAMVFIVGRILLVREHDDTGRDESRDVIDVAVSIVADVALAEPDRLSNTEVLGKDPFVTLA